MSRGRVRRFCDNFGAYAAGDRLLYVGHNGRRHVTVATAAGPKRAWRASVRGPATREARVAAAASRGGAAAVFGTHEAAGLGHVFLVREVGGELKAAQRLFPPAGSIRAVAVATANSGDVLVAWDRSGTIESRLWYARSKRLSRVQTLGTVTAAVAISVAVGEDRRATVAWTHQDVEPQGTTETTVMATARRATRGFLLPAKRLDAYQAATYGRARVTTAYTADGRGVIAWTGRATIRAAFLRGRSMSQQQDIAPFPSDAFGSDRDLGRLVVAPNGAAAVTVVSPLDKSESQIVAVPLAPGAAAFGAPGARLDTRSLLEDPTAAFDPRTNRLVAAWYSGSGWLKGRIELATRPSP